MCEAVAENHQLGMFFIDWARVQNFLEPGVDVLMVGLIIFDKDPRKYDGLFAHKKCPPVKFSKTPFRCRINIREIRKRTDGR